MLHVNFNAYANYVTDNLYQWDVNQDLVINGLGLLTAPEIHFANANMNRAIVRRSSIDNGVITVRIPNSLLQSALTIKAYVGVYEDETFKVIETVEIPVIGRAKPYDYTIEDSDEEIYSFNALEQLVTESVEEINVIGGKIIGDCQAIYDQFRNDANAGLGYATRSTTYDLMLSASGWTGDAVPYTNTLSVPSATANNNIELVTPSTVTVDEVNAYAKANIASATQANGSVTVCAYGIKPTINLPITVIVRGD